jgi:hypothetical protein
MKLADGGGFHGRSDAKIAGVLQHYLEKTGVGLLIADNQYSAAENPGLIDHRFAPLLG